MQLKEEDRFIEILTGSYCVLDLAKITGNAEFIELDLGCGKGSFTSKLAERYPDRAVLAADVMIGRLRKLVKRNQRAGVANITALRVEAQLLVSRFLPDNGLDRLHLLCPDPWPKERHRGHRLVTADFATQLRRVLKLGGVLHFSSDDVPYRDSVERILDGCGLFERDDSAIADIADIKTDFEELWLSTGKDVRHYAYRALPVNFDSPGH